MEDKSPGWDSITAAFSSAYPTVEPWHKGLVPGLALGSPLQGVSAYRGPDGWHFVTYGLTELWVKDSEDEQRSGWGYELTMLTPATDDPPDWAFSTFAKLAQSTWDTGRVHLPGDRIDVLEAIDGGTSALEAFAVWEDPVVAPTEFPFGNYAFHRLVGITRAELDEMKTSSTAAVLERFDGALLTDPGRN